MLLALVFRGGAFEFRWREPVHRAFCYLAFSGGSLLAALSQGVVLGALMQGVSVQGRAYVGGWLDWLTPFSVLTGISVAVGYALLRAAGRHLAGDEGEGRLQQAHSMAWWLGGATLAAIVFLSLATPFLRASYFDTWLRWPGILAAAPVPVPVALASWAFARSLRAGHEVVRRCC